MIKPTRFVALDGIRGVAAIVVMIYHYTQYLTYGLFINAPLAVDLFFCLSGFVLSHAYIDRLAQELNVINFIKLRIIRLYPIFLIGAFLGFIGLFLKSILNETTLTLDRVAIAGLLNIFYIPYLSDFNIHYINKKINSSVFPINDPGWSLFYELIVNVFLAMIWVRFKSVLKPTLLIVTSSLLLLILNYQYAPGFNLNTFVGGLPRACFSIFSGVLVYLVYKKFFFKLVKFELNIYILLIIILVLFNLRISFWYWMICISFLVPLIVLLGAVSSVGGKTQSLFNYIGWLSYPIYCIHFPVFMLYTSITSGDSTYTGLDCLICSFITVLLIHVTLKYVEPRLRSIVITIMNRLNLSRV